MRTWRLGVVVLLWAAVLAIGARADDAETSPAPSTQPAVIDVGDKAAIDANMNKDVVVEGVVDTAQWSPTGKVANLEFRKAADSKFIAVVFVRHREELDKAFNGDFTKTLAGARVRIKGKLKEYRNRPEIVIDSPTQVTILEPAPPADKG